MNYNNVSFEKAFGTFSQLDVSDLPEICFSGKSNVGKSSLINCTVGRKNLVRVSNKPGKTVTVNFYRLDKIRLVDLPGYGFAKVSYDEKLRWSELMEGYFSSGRNIFHVFQLIDMRHMPSEDDLSMIDFLHGSGVPFSIVLTKSDKLNKTEFADSLQKITDLIKSNYGDKEIIVSSSQTGLGRERIREIIESAV